jgi:peptidoglycan-N-acetylglucosamine deacetylase
MIEYHLPQSALGSARRNTLPGLIVTLTFLIGLGFLVWYLVAAPGSQLMGATFARGSRDVSVAALTFDDGPGADTPKILDALQQAGVCATFFLCGSNVERYPATARRIAADGHEIGNHTYSHPRLLGKTPGHIALEIERAQVLIERHTGKKPKLFRPPYGLRWFGLFPILRQKNLQAVMWSINGRDWRSSSDAIARRIVGQMHPGAIILLHDGVPPGENGNRQATVECLPQILQQLAGQYRLVTVSELRSTS